MEHWFTVEQIDHNTFSISEYRHWEETHCYLLCGEKSAVLIDTGLGVSNIRKIVDSLTELPVMVVTTHVHWDHIGGHKYFDHIAVHEAEKDWLSVGFPIPLQVVGTGWIIHGMALTVSYPIPGKGVVFVLFRKCVPIARAAVTSSSRLIFSPRFIASV